MDNVNRFLTEHPEWRGQVDLVIYPPTLDEAFADYPELIGDRLVAAAHEPTTFGVTRLAMYVSLRLKGNTHKFAVMVACQRGPRLMTDAVYFQNSRQVDAQFISPQQRDKAVAIARRHGYNPQRHDTYVSDIARFFGDPEAWVPQTGGRGYIKKICEQRGWECHGAVETKYREPDADPHETGVKLAPDLVNAGIKRMVAKDPKLKHKSRAELRARAIAKYGPSS